MKPSHFFRKPLSGASRQRVGSQGESHGEVLWESTSNDHRNRPHVLLIVGEFPPVGGGGVIRVVKLIKYLVPLGWQVTVLCSAEPPGEHWDESLLEEIPKAVRVIRVAHPFGGISHELKSSAKARMDRRSRRFRTLKAIKSAAQSLIAIPDGWAPWAVRVAIAPPRHLGHPDVILSSGPPHTVHILGRWLARRAQAPLVMDMRDEWTLRPSRQSNMPWRRWLEYRLESGSIATAYRVVSVSATSRNRYADRYPTQAPKFVDIPNGFDPADISALPPATTRPTNNDVLTIGYAGSFQIGVDVQQIFAAIGDVVDESLREGRSVHVELVGPMLVEHVDFARALIPERQLTVRPFVPHREALAAMHGWDVLLIVANDGQASLAGKTYECLALRKPILLVAPEGPATELIRSTSSGEIADPSDGAGIRRAARRAIALADRPSFQGAPDSVLERYDRSRQAGLWSELLHDAIVGREPEPPPKGGPFLGSSAEPPDSPASEPS